MSIRRGSSIIAGAGQSRVLEQPAASGTTVHVVSRGLIEGTDGVVYLNSSSTIQAVTSTTDLAGSSSFEVFSTGASGGDDRYDIATGELDAYYENNSALADTTVSPLPSTVSTYRGDIIRILTTTPVGVTFETATGSVLANDNPNGYTGFFVISGLTTLNANALRASSEFTSDGRERIMVHTDEVDIRFVAAVAEHQTEDGLSSGTALPATSVRFQIINTMNDAGIRIYPLTSTVTVPGFHLVDDNLGSGVLHVGLIHEPVDITNRVNSVVFQEESTSTIYNILAWSEYENSVDEVNIRIHSADPNISTAAQYNFTLDPSIDFTDETTSPYADPTNSDFVLIGDGTEYTIPAANGDIQNQLLSVLTVATTLPALADALAVETWNLRVDVRTASGTIVRLADVDDAAIFVSQVNNATADIGFTFTEADSTNRFITVPTTATATRIGTTEWVRIDGLYGFSDDDGDEIIINTTNTIRLNEIVRQSDPVNGVLLFRGFDFDIDSEGNQVASVQAAAVDAAETGKIPVWSNTVDYEVGDLVLYRADHPDVTNTNVQSETLGIFRATVANRNIVPLSPSLSQTSEWDYEGIIPTAIAGNNTNSSTVNGGDLRAASQNWVGQVEVIANAALPAANAADAIFRPANLPDTEDTYVLNIDDTGAATWVAESTGGTGNQFADQDALETFISDKVGFTTDISALPIRELSNTAITIRQGEVMDDRGVLYYKFAGADNSFTLTTVPTNPTEAFDDGGGTPLIQYKQITNPVQTLTDLHTPGDSVNDIGQSVRVATNGNWELFTPSTGGGGTTISGGVEGTVPVFNADGDNIVNSVITTGTSDQVTNIISSTTTAGASLDGTQGATPWTFSDQATYDALASTAGDVADASIIFDGFNPNLIFTGITLGTAPNWTFTHINGGAVEDNTSTQVTTFENFNWSRTPFVADGVTRGGDVEIQVGADFSVTGSIDWIHTTTEHIPYWSGSAWEDSGLLQHIAHSVDYTISPSFESTQDNSVGDIPSGSFRLETDGGTLVAQNHAWVIAQQLEHLNTNDDFWQSDTVNEEPVNFSLGEHIAFYVSDTQWALYSVDSWIDANTYGITHIDSAGTHPGLSTLITYGVVGSEWPNVSLQSIEATRDFQVDGIISGDGSGLTDVNADTVNSLTVETAVPSGAVFTDTTYNVFTGANGTDDGSTGLVPAPSANENTEFLRGDGNWAAPSFTLDIDGLTELGATPADDDFFILYDASAGTNVKLAASDLPGGGGGGTGDITSVIAGNGLSGGADTGDATLNVNTATAVPTFSSTDHPAGYLVLVTSGDDQGWWRSDGTQFEQISNNVTPTATGLTDGFVRVRAITDGGSVAGTINASGESNLNLRGISPINTQTSTTGGGQVFISADDASATSRGWMLPSDFSKLAGIETGAQVNADGFGSISTVDADGNVIATANAAQPNDAIQIEGSGLDINLDTSGSVPKITFENTTSDTHVAVSASITPVDGNRDATGPPQAFDSTGTVSEIRFVGLSDVLQVSQPAGSSIVTVSINALPDPDNQHPSSITSMTDNGTFETDRFSLQTDNYVISVLSDIGGDAAHLVLTYDKGTETTFWSANVDTSQTDSSAVLSSITGATGVVPTVGDLSTEGNRDIDLVVTTNDLANAIGDIVEVGSVDITYYIYSATTASAADLIASETLTLDLMKTPPGDPTVQAGAPGAGSLPELGVDNNQIEEGDTGTIGEAITLGAANGWDEPTAPTTVDIAVNATGTVEVGGQSLVYTAPTGAGTDEDGNSSITLTVPTVTYSRTRSLRWGSWDTDGSGAITESDIQDLTNWGAGTSDVTLRKGVVTNTDPTFSNDIVFTNTAGEYIHIIVDIGTTISEILDVTNGIPILSGGGVFEVTEVGNYRVYRQTTTVFPTTIRYRLS